MKTDNICLIKPDIPSSRAYRFMQRMSACKGTLDDQETRMAPVVAQSGSIQPVSDVCTSQGKDASGLPRPASDASAANTSDGSFLKLYMQAFAAARQ